MFQINSYFNNLIARALQILKNRHWSKSTLSYVINIILAYLSFVSIKSDDNMGLKNIEYRILLV